MNVGSVFYRRFNVDLAVPSRLRDSPLPTDTEKSIYVLLDDDTIDFWDFLVALRELRHKDAATLVLNTCKNYPPGLYNMFDAAGKCTLDVDKLQQYGAWDKWKDTDYTLEDVATHNKACTDFMLRAHTALLIPEHAPAAARGGAAATQKTENVVSFDLDDPRRMDS
jgi:hypothetical protein